MEELQPQSQTGFCCVLYSPEVSVPIGLQQASHSSNSQQQATCLKLQPAVYTISANLQLLLLVGKGLANLQWLLQLEKAWPAVQLWLWVGRSLTGNTF